MGERVIRLNTEDFGDALTTLALDGDGWSGASEILTSRRVVDLGRVKSVWWRRPHRLVPPPNLSEQQTLFAEVELDHAFHGMLATLDCYWMSHPDSLRASRLKLEQLHRAQSLGFDVPRTIVTNDPETVRSFFEASSGKIVYKTLSSPTLAAERLQHVTPDALPSMTMTTPITSRELERVASVRTVPCLFQEYVPKRAEYRVTVIGDTAVPVEIDSQSEPSSVHDWRRARRVPLRLASLPTGLTERCLAFVRSYGLNYSALDLILTPDGRYVFLENNPNGQFHFIDQALPQARLVARIASTLARGAN